MKDYDEKIEKIRYEMIQTGLRYGLKNERTLQLSTRLDALLNSSTINQHEIKESSEQSHLLYKH